MTHAVPLSCLWLEPALAALTPAASALRARLVRRAHADIGIEEQTGAPNRSPYLDEVIAEAGSPLGSAWCGCVAQRWARDAGVQHPTREAGAVRAWVTWAKENGTWFVAGTYTPPPGDFVVYDMNPDTIADHIGVVARVHARGPRTIEGNTSWAGFSREGVAVAMKPVTASRVLGYIVPRPI